MSRTCKTYFSVYLSTLLYGLTVPVFPLFTLRWFISGWGGVWHRWSNFTAQQMQFSLYGITHLYLLFFFFTGICPILFSNLLSVGEMRGSKSHPNQTKPKKQKILKKSMNCSVSDSAFSSWSTYYPLPLLSDWYHFTDSAGGHSVLLPSCLLRSLILSLGDLLYCKHRTSHFSGYYGNMDGASLCSLNNEYIQQSLQFLTYEQSRRGHV